MYYKGYKMQYNHRQLMYKTHVWNNLCMKLTSLLIKVPLETNLLVKVKAIFDSACTYVYSWGITHTPPISVAILPSYITVADCICYCNVVNTLLCCSGRCYVNSYRRYINKLTLYQYADDVPTHMHYFYYYNKRSAVQGWERVIYTRSVRRPQPHNTNL